MPDAMSKAINRIWSGIGGGRHLEAYAIFVLGLALTALGLLGAAESNVLLSALLLATTFLVFRATVEPSSRQVALDTVLQNRESLGSLSQLLARAAEVWLYAPTGVNVIVHAADIRRHVLDRGGRIRVVVQDPDSPGKQTVQAQLDDSLDFDRTLENSIATLARMTAWGDCRFRLLPFSPGFSMVVVNPGKPDGYLILELHGFQDENITDRMHVRISRSESLHWFDYWVARYQAMWEAAREPAPASIGLSRERRLDGAG